MSTDGFIVTLLDSSSTAAFMVLIILVGTDEERDPPGSGRPCAGLKYLNRAIRDNTHMDKIKHVAIA